MESESSSLSLTLSATLYRPDTRASGSASSKHILLAHRTNSIGRFQPCASFGFFQIGHLSFTKITFFDTCQKTMSTHAPQFRNNLFCSEITPTSIQSHSSYPVHTAYPVQLGKTLLCPWPFTFHPHKPNASIHLSSFHLPRLGHKYDLPSLYRQQVSISYRASFLLSPGKTPGLPIAMAGSKRPDEGPSNAPPVICRRVE